MSKTIKLSSAAPSELRTEQEAAEYLRMKPQTLAKWRSEGNKVVLPYIKVGRSVRYRQSALDDYIAANERAHT